MCIRDRPSTLYGAAKLMGSLGRRLTIGTLSALAAPNEVTIEQDGRDRASRVAESYKLFNVVRLKLRVGDNAHIGLAATAMNHFEDATQYPLVAGTGGNDSCLLYTSRCV